MGHILVDGKYSERIEPFFKRLGNQLYQLGLISEHEQDLLAKAIVSKQERIPNLQNEKAKAIYLAACFEIGRIKPKTEYRESAKQDAPWWESLLP